jgi:hypothetical protein
LNTLVFREFSPYGHDKDLAQLADGVKYEPPLIDIRDEHLNSLGINNHMVEMPIVKISNESMSNAELVTEALSHVEIEYDDTV